MEISKELIREVLEEMAKTTLAPSQIQPIRSVRIVKCNNGYMVEDYSSNVMHVAPTLAGILGVITEHFEPDAKPK